MKAFLYLFFFTFTILPGASYAQKSIRSSDYQKSYQVLLTDKNENPSHIKLLKEVDLKKENLNEWLRKNIGMDQKLSFELVDQFTDRAGHTHFRYTQKYNGIPLEHKMLIAHSNKNQYINSLNGDFIVRWNTKEASPPNKSIMLEADAIDAALNHVNAKVYRWEVPEEEEMIKEISGNQEASFFPIPQLTYLQVDEKLKLAYKMDVYAFSKLYRSWIYIDAFNGEVLKEVSRIHTTDVTGTGVTVFSGSRSMTTDSILSDSFQLRDNSRGSGIFTYNLQKSTNYGTSVDFTDSDNYWNNVNANWDEYASDAHWGTQKTYDYFLNKHGRNSIDGSGMAMLSYLHYSTGYNNAFWNGTAMTYGDGSGVPLVSIDVIGHEMTHGVTDYTANLIYSYESGALNESFSDIFGKAIEYFAKPGDFDWLIGGDLGAFRDMQNPNTYGDPDTYKGYNWYAGSSDNGGVHTNSGVQNFWFYLLVSGGSGTNDLGNNYNVQGLGMDSAAQIAYRTLSVYLTPNSDYDDARYYSIQSAIDLFGACSHPVEQTTRAWYAVGVGTDWVPGVVADFYSTDSISCYVPFPAYFRNNSSNGQAFTWYFGDSTQSNDIDPVHTFNSFGIYDIKLVVDGGACGTDSITKTAYINLNSDNPCRVNMGASDQTSCIGTLFDNGGELENYWDDTVFIMTIQPPGASTVVLDFKSFAFEPGSGSETCDFDHLAIYDGPDTSSSSLLGRWCNDNGSPGIVASSGGTITVLQYSDPFVNYSGFEADWTCLLPGAPPIAQFDINQDYSCSGLVYFTDKSINNASSWLWDFGDGSTSTQQHPTHYYDTNGTYTVQLIAYNGNGADTLIQLNSVNINMTDGPTVTNRLGCPGDKVTFFSSSNGGTIQWFDSTRKLLQTGSSFTTVINPPQSFYVNEFFQKQTLFGGPAENNFGPGGNFNGDQHLIFDCYKPTILKSVKVYAQSAYNRTIQLRSSDGIILQDTTVFLSNGEQRVTLNFNIPVGTDLQLGTPDGSQDLFRNSDSANYPYEISDLISIKRSSAGGLDGYRYYYFFYSWEVEGPDCQSEMVEAKVYADPSEVPVANFDYSYISDSLLSFTSNALRANEYLWDFGDGTTSTSMNPEHQFNSGTFIITLTVSNDCGEHAFVDTVLIEKGIKDGISWQKLLSEIKVYPNPAKNLLHIEASEKYQGSIITLNNMFGQEVLKTMLKNTPKTVLKTSDLSCGVYLLHINFANNMLYKKVVINR